MKKLCHYLTFRQEKSIHKLLLTMKISSFILFASITCLIAGEVNSQTAHINLNANGRTIENVLNDIEKQTNYLFFYNKKDIDVDRILTGQFTNQPVADVLAAIFSESSINYSMVKDYIILSKTGFNGNNGASRQQSVSGLITDASTGEPLPGVNVIVEGTTQGVVSDMDGKYNISIASENTVLIFSYVGYTAEKVSVSNRTIINVALIPDIKKLEEVVVIGYGIQKKGSVTSSIASVKQDNFVQGGIKDVGQLIQGKVAGLTISTVSGDPTSNTIVKLRGNTTLYGTSTSPLVIVDGVPGDFNTVAPEDIEAIDVLKDGSAAAIYGTQGTNGVIIITTRKASGAYKSSVEYSGYTSTSSISKRLDMSTAADIRKQISLGYRSSSDDLGYNTNWLDEITRTPFTHSHNLTIRGGNSKTNYLASANYKYAEGIFLKSDNRILNVRADLNHSMLNDKIKINLGAITRYDKFHTTADGYSFNGYTYRQANIYNPTAPVKNQDGSWYEEVGAFNYDNPVARLYESDGQNSSQFSRFNGTISIEPIKGLIAKLLTSYSKYDESRGYAETKNHISTKRYGLNGYASTGSTESIDRLLDFTVEYTKNINKHNFGLLAGYSYKDNDYYTNWMRNDQFPTDIFGYSNIQLGTGLKEGDTNTGIYSARFVTNLIGFFGRLNYNYNDKYLLMASLRREAASQLYGTKNPWGNFPAISAGWRLSKESFMSKFTFLDDLKIRGGYGVTGSQPSDSFLGMATMGYSGYFYSDGEWKNSLGPTQNSNPNLRWEEKQETNIGFDYSLLSNRISGSFDYYYRRINGLLYYYTVPMPPNQVATTLANVGKMDNKGIEILLNFVPVKKENFEWSSSINFSTNHNKLVTLSNELYKSSTGYINAGGTGEPIQTYTHRLKVGGPIGNFYGYKVVDISDQGKWIYQDKSGNHVDEDNFAKVDSNKMVLGNGVPKFFAGWNHTFKYKNLDLSITMRGAFGFQILNFDRMYLENTKTAAQYNRLKSAYDKVYGKAVLSTQEDLEFNSYYIEDGDYWKIDNITLGYNFRIKNNKYIQSARIYASSLNTMTFTGYKGLDPEVDVTGVTPGNDYRDKYPTVRTFTIGLNIKF